MPHSLFTCLIHILSFQDEVVKKGSDVACDATIASLKNCVLLRCSNSNKLYYSVFFLFLSEQTLRLDCLSLFLVRLTINFGIFYRKLCLFPWSQKLSSSGFSLTSSLLVFPLLRELVRRNNTSYETLSCLFCHSNVTPKHWVRFPQSQHWVRFSQSQHWVQFSSIRRLIYSWLVEETNSISLNLLFTNIFLILDTLSFD
jgi:hypothetical protein